MSLLVGTGLTAKLCGCAQIILEAYNGEIMLARWYHRTEEETDKCLWEIVERKNGPRITHFKLHRPGKGCQKLLAR
jgi:hypothetical protein